MVLCHAVTRLLTMLSSNLATHLAGANGFYYPCAFLDRMLMKKEANATTPPLSSNQTKPVQYRIARGVTDRPEKETKQLSCMLRALH